MKKTIFVWITIMVMFIMAGCGNATEVEQETKDKVIENSATGDTVVQNQVTEDPATEDPAVEDQVTEDPVTEDPAIEDTVTPSEEAASDSENVFRADEYMLQLPEQWIGNYTVDSFEDEEAGLSIVAFYAADCHEETGEGWLFSLARYESMDYQDLPAYQVLGTQDGVAYVAIYPTDVQTEGASDTAKAQYVEVLQGVEEVINSFQFMEPLE